MRAIIAVLAAGTAATAGAQAPTPTFCERLAPQLGMTKKVSTGKDAITTWEVNPLGGLKNALFGGSTTFSFGISPVGDSTIADYKRLEETCAQDAKNYVCRISEPLQLTVNTARGKAEVQSTPGEKATVMTKGTRIVCRNSLVS